MKTLTRPVVAAVLAAALAACTSAPGGAPSSPARQSLGPVRLVAYSGCDELLSGLREKAAANVGPYGFGGPRIMYMEDSSASRESRAEQTPDHSTTNVHEAGVDEPDLVKTDGDRVLTVSGGVLRVIDTATRKVTASLDLNRNGRGYAPADLLVSGDRALVLMQGGGMVTSRVADSIAPMGETRYVLVDLSGEPRVIGTIKPEGSHVDARMVGSTVRLVTRSTPDIAFPEPRGSVSEAERKAMNQAVVRSAPLTAWLPEIEITDASGQVRKATVPCERVSHPAEYTGTSMLTLHTLDLSAGVTAAGSDPIALAADGDIVYGTGRSLYVASNPRWWWPIDPMPVEEDAPATEPSPEEPTPGVPPTRTQGPPPEETEVHRFDITRPGAPAYAASGKVPGRLLNQYSLSEHEGHLRVATTLSSPDGRDSSSGVHVLDANSMDVVGQVGGLGKGERIYSVRFIGPAGYVVTFRQVDPLYTLDLRDPAAPKVTGELKITGYSAYLHPAGDGRLIGIGQEASAEGRTLGTQISLFDVADPANPRRLARMFQQNSGSEAEWDPHAFLYWPKTGTAVVPLSSYTPDQYRNGAVVLRITDSEVTRVGTIEHPRTPTAEGGYQPGIQRSMVIGESIWTFSYEGVQVNDLATLDRQAWIPLTS
jgi:uncharacterized secreted protein with C-terminal beta-propeller domain